MSQLPSVTGKKVIAALEKVGFEVARVRGNNDGRRTVVPVHSGKTIGRGLLSQILHDTELSREEFRKLL